MFPKENAYTHTRKESDFMSYSINQVYKDVEKILKRPINTFDYQAINNWVNNYDLDYIEFSFSQLKNMTNIYSTNYINTYLFRNYEMYNSIKKSILSSTPIIQTTPPIVEETKVVEEEKVDEDMCTDKGWEGCSKLEQEYWCKLFAHSLYPKEYPEPRIE